MIDWKHLIFGDKNAEKISSPKYLKSVKKALSKIIPNETININKRLKMERGLYSPQLDVTVGPFAIEEGLKKSYESLLLKHKDFLEEIRWASVNHNDIDFDRNPNPRCFIAIEVEKITKNNKKHVLGSICNAYILGKVGIVVTYGSPKTLRSIYRYLKFSEYVQKTDGYLFKNVALITKSRFDRILRVFGQDDL